VEGHTSDSAAMSLNAANILQTLANGLVLAAQEGVRSSILGEGSQFCAFSNSGAVKAVILAVLLASLGSLVGIVDLP
jgi:hypothetical protein